MKNVAGPELYAELVKKYLDPDIRHDWYTKEMSKEQLDDLLKRGSIMKNDMAKANRAANKLVARRGMQHRLFLKDPRSLLDL